MNVWHSAVQQRGFQKKVMGVRLTGLLIAAAASASTGDLFVMLGRCVWSAMFTPAPVQEALANLGAFVRNSGFELTTVRAAQLLALIVGAALCLRSARGWARTFAGASA